MAVTVMWSLSALQPTRDLDTTCKAIIAHLISNVLLLDHDKICFFLPIFYAFPISLFCIN